MNEELKQESNKSNGIFDVNYYDNNIKSEEDELSQKGVRFKTAVDFLNYKKQNNLSEEEAEKKLIEAYGIEKAKQVIKDVEDIKKVGKIYESEIKKDITHNQIAIAEELTKIILQHQDIPYDLFAERFKNLYSDMGYSTANILMEVRKNLRESGYFKSGEVKKTTSK